MIVFLLGVIAGIGLVIGIRKLLTAAEQKVSAVINSSSQSSGESK